jgi:hypothetical protein
VGEDIGDIDVLVIDHEAKLVLAIEVKDFEFARTPVELKHELDKLFIGDKSTLFHHKERLRLLETNLEQSSGPRPLDSLTDFLRGEQVVGTGSGGSLIVA